MVGRSACRKATTINSGVEQVPYIFGELSVNCHTPMALQGSTNVHQYSDGTEKSRSASGLAHPLSSQGTFEQCAHSRHGFHRIVYVQAVYEGFTRSASEWRCLILQETSRPYANDHM